VNEFTFFSGTKWYSSERFSRITMEIGMFGDYDDAGHSSSGSSAWNYRGASAADRATFRLWIRGVIVFYVSILMIAGAVAIGSYNDVGLTQLANLYAHATAGSPESNKSGSGAIRRPATATSAWW
jgi:hypothetical protein